MAGRWVADKSWLLIMVLQIDLENSATGGKTKIPLFIESCPFQTFTVPHFMIDCPALFLGCGKHYSYMQSA